MWNVSNISILILGKCQTAFYLKQYILIFYNFFRGTGNGDGCNEDIKDDIEEDERELHSNNLLTIGAIARKAPAHCSHVLYTLLMDRSKR